MDSPNSRLFYLTHHNHFDNSVRMGKPEEPVCAKDRTSGSAGIFGSVPTCARLAVEGLGFRVQVWHWGNKQGIITSWLG